MDINKIYEIDLYVNGELVDVVEQDKLNLRFNNIFADPSKVETQSVEYSFSFSLPITDNNTRILDYSNVLAKRNKFSKHFPTKVNVDGELVFEGDLIIQSVSKEDGFKCNLYVNRLNTVDKIFGDSVMSDIDNWKVDYPYFSIINDTNKFNDISYPTDCFYPFVSYGMFQQVPTTADTYTSKYDLDDTKRFYMETFYPSANLLKTVEKCFNHKGYDVQGDIFSDDVMKRIYTSVSLADGQAPIYPLGNPWLGRLNMNFKFNSVNGTPTASGVCTSVATYVPHKLDNPRQKYSIQSREDMSFTDYYNWEYNNVYDIWSQNNKFTQITDCSNYGLFRTNRVVVPNDGYYKVRLQYTMSIPTTFKSYPCYKYDHTDRTVAKLSYTPTPDFKEFYSELQLVKNTEDNSIGLISPDAYTYSSTISTSSRTNKAPSIYPHEPLGSYVNPIGSTPYVSYFPKSYTSMIQFDPKVNNNFILGQSCCYPSLHPSVIKNGKSWDKTCEYENFARYECDGYNGVKATVTTRGNVTYTQEPSDYKKNTLPNSQSKVVFNSMYTKATGTIETIVFLKKNDYLQLKLVQKQFENKAETDAEESGRSSSTTQQSEYMTDAQISIEGSFMLEAFSPDDISITSSYMDWNNPSRYDDKLNIANFLNKEEKMSDFINNFIKEFNLSYSQKGKTITLNKQQINYSNNNYVVDLSDRISDADIEAQAIDFPSEMYVAYNINKEERGVYISAERNATDEQMQSNSWLDYADYGYDKIQMLEDEYAEPQTAQTKTSYNWFEDFKITCNGQNSNITIPIIAKDEWMIDGYKYADMMKKDGYGLPKRYWFPSSLTSNYVYLNNIKEDSYKVYLKKVTDTYNGVKLCYKEKGIDGNETLLTRYFNIVADISTNYISFETYLTTREYIQIKNGSHIRIDDDIYIVTSISGYDPSGANKSKITAFKK